MNDGGIDLIWVWCINDYTTPIASAEPRTTMRTVASAVHRAWYQSCGDGTAAYCVIVFDGDAKRVRSFICAFHDGEALADDVVIGRLSGLIAESLGGPHL